MKNILLLLLAGLLSVYSSSAQTFTGSGGAIPDDGNSISFEIAVNLPQSAIDTLTFGLESICFNVEHTWLADLAISLIAPDGTLINMVSGLGGDTDFFTGTCLSAHSETSIYQAQPPYSGTFRPFGDMGKFNNTQNPNGTWTLKILDTYAFADAGQLLDWQITFGSNPCRPFAFESSNLPIVEIFTGGQPIPNEPKIKAQMRVIDNGPGQRNFAGQTAAAFEGQIGIELRGNSSQQFPKKAYSVEIQGAEGEDLDTAFLGFPSGSDFALVANFSDKTLMRNALSYRLASDMGEYGTRTRFCELILDQSYQGVYTFTERIKRDKARVDISKLTPEDTEGTALTGGYIIKVDRNDTPGWYSNFSFPNFPDGKTFMSYDYPRHDAIVPEQATYIQAFVDSFEVSLQGADFQDPKLGWRHYADEKSALDYLFLNEMSKNVDGYRLSTYFYKKREDKGRNIFFGPAWDFDIAWLNADYCEAFRPEDWAYNLNYVCNDAGVPFWWERFMADSSFQENAACRWQALRQHVLSEERIFAMIDSMALEMEESQARNFRLWPILGIYVWPNPGTLPDSYAGEVIKLKGWIQQRFSWLDAQFALWELPIDASFHAQALDGFNWQFVPQFTGNNLLYHWDFGDGESSAEPAPLHTYAGTGTYEVKLRVSTAYGCVHEESQIIHLINTGTAELTAEGLQVYPNPVGGQLYVPVPQALQTQGQIRIFNAMQQEVYNATYRDKAMLSLSVLNWVPGVYSVLVEAEGVTRVGRVVVR